MKKEASITAAEIVYLRRTHHAVYVCPRLKEVRVDGYKQYRITDHELAELRQAHNGLVN